MQWSETEPRSGPWGRLRRQVAAWHDGWCAARERARQRRWLAGLDDRMLKDIGLTRGGIESECGKWLWRR